MTGLALKVAIALAALAILGGGYAAWRSHQRSEGGAIERANQEKENAALSVRARKGIVSFDTCDLADGVYDFAKGSCQLPPAQ